MENLKEMSGSSLDKQFTGYYTGVFDLRTV